MGRKGDFPQRVDSLALVKKKFLLMPTHAHILCFPALNSAIALIHTKQWSLRWSQNPPQTPLQLCSSPSVLQWLPSTPQSSALHTLTLTTFTLKQSFLGFKSSLVLSHFSPPFFIAKFPSKRYLCVSFFCVFYSTPPPSPHQSDRHYSTFNETSLIKVNNGRG